MRQPAFALLILLLPSAQAALVYDSTSLPLVNTSARWGPLQPSFPVGYFLAAGSVDRQCTRGLARFQALSSWVGSSAGQLVAALDIFVAGEAVGRACTLEFQLYQWPDTSSPSSQVGAAVAHLVNGTLVDGLQRIPILASAQWLMQPRQWYGLLARALDSCGGNPTPYLRLFTVRGPAEGALWPAQYAAGVQCPGGASPPTADTSLQGTEWKAALFTRAALVLRGAEGAAGFPGSPTGNSLPLGPSSATMQLIWEYTTLDLTLLQIRLSLYGTGNPGVTAFNATLLVKLCYLDINGDCVGSMGLPTITQRVDAVIPGGGAPAAATVFELPAGMTRKITARAALRLSVQSLVASDGSPPPVSGNACKLLTCGVNAGTTDPGVTAYFLSNTYAADGNKFYTQFPPGSGPVVPFPCMAVRVVPSDPDVAFPSPTPSVSPTPSPTSVGTPTASDTPTTAGPTASGTPTTAGTRAGTPSPTVSGTPSPTATPTHSKSSEGLASQQPPLSGGAVFGIVVTVFFLVAVVALRVSPALLALARRLAHCCLQGVSMRKRVMPRRGAVMGAMELINNPVVRSAAPNAVARGAA